MKPAVTRPQVFTAADKISAAGQQPTVAAVRALLGSGSFTTLTAYLREWREQANGTTTPEVDIPETVTEALNRAAEIVWTAATDHFRQELATLQKESARLIATHQAALEEALQEIGELEIRYEGTVNDNCRTTQALTEAQATINSLNQENAVLHAQLAAAEARIHELALLLDRLTLPAASLPTPGPIDAPATAKPPRKRNAQKPADAPTPLTEPQE